MYVSVQYDEWKRNRNGDWDNPPAISEVFATRAEAEAWIKRNGKNFCNVKIIECQGELPKNYWH